MSGGAGGEAAGIDPDRAALALAEIAAEAGRLLASVVDRKAGQVAKQDGSPATAADIASEKLILRRLKETFPGVAVVAEESAASHAGTLFFLVDPLDGTKDYLSGDGEYSVNIALVAGTRPIASALAAPPLRRIWAAGTAALCADLDEGGRAGPWRPVSVRAAPPGALVALSSRRHGDAEGESCLDLLSVASRRTASSAAKFGLIASGEADLYVRCGPTMEWDTAAGDHVLTRAGGRVVGPSGHPLSYGHAARGYRNGAFAALGDPSLAGRLILPREEVNPRPGRP